VPLTNLTEAFRQNASDYVSMDVFPPLPVEHKSDVFYRWSRADLLRRAIQQRAPGALVEMGGMRLTTGTYTANDYALGYPIPDGIRRNADGMLSLDYAATEYLTSQALLDREVNWATAYFTALSGWATTVTGQAGASDATHVKYWNTSGSSPIEDMLVGKKTIKKSTGMDPNVAVLGYSVKQSLKTNPEVIDRLKYGQTAPGPVLVKDSDLAQLFEIPKVVTMGAIQTTSIEGAATDTFDFIGGNNVLLTYAAPAPGLMVASGGYTFNWKGLAGVTASGWRIKKYRNEDRESDICEIQQSYDHGLVAAALGYLMSAVLDPTVPE
jgi:hypothetical protein